MLIMQQYDEFSSVAMKCFKICCIYDTKKAITPLFSDALTRYERSTLTASQLASGSISFYSFIELFINTYLRTSDPAPLPIFEDCFTVQYYIITWMQAHKKNCLVFTHTNLA